MPPKRRSARKPDTQDSASLQHGSEDDPQPSPEPHPPPSTRQRKTPSRGRNHLVLTDPPSTSERIAGARMSGVRHSGLLAKDQRALEEVAKEESAKINAQLATSIGQRGGEREEEGMEEEKGELHNVLGRDIFAIQSLNRSAKKGKQKMIERTAQLSGQGSAASDGSRKRGRAGESAGMEKEEEEERERATREEGGRGESERGVRIQSATQARLEAAGKKKGKVGSKRGRAYTSASDQDTTEEEEEEEEEEEGEDEEEEEELASIADQLNRGVAAKELGRHVVEDYFTAHSGRSTITSDHTLSRLARPRLEQEAVQSALQAVPSPFQKDYQLLYEEYRSLYSYWLLQMHNGFNILLYGLGSKKRLIEDFCEQCLSSSCRLVVNGYFPGLTVKQILSCLSSELLGHSGSFKSHTEHAESVTTTLRVLAGKEEAPKEVFLLIHNIDGPMLRNERTQTALSVLAMSPHIHIVASIDHINAPLLWDQTKLSRFNWLWHDTSTFEPYREETSYENSLLVQQSGSLALSSLTHVMRSLTPNARGIFELLAKYQLEHKKEMERSYPGLSFSECYRRCRERFLVNSDLTLRAQLTEFRDHKLIRSATGADGVEYLSIPIDDATLSQFIEELSEQ